MNLQEIAWNLAHEREASVLIIEMRRNGDCQSAASLDNREHSRDAVIEALVVLLAGTLEHYKSRLAVERSHLILESQAEADRLYEVARLAREVGSEEAIALQAYSASYSQNIRFRRGIELASDSTRNADYTVTGWEKL